MRRTTLIATAAVLLCSAASFGPAFAGDLMTGGIPLGNASNLGVISNTAAGIQNKAQQQVMGVQAGGGLAGPFGTASNLGNVSNLAAGVGNTAKQQVFGMQAGGGGVKTPFALGGFNSNAGTVSNSAVGIGNTAQQQVKAMQFGAPGALFNQNLGTVSNLAAGIGNKAQQQVNVRGGTSGKRATPSP
ncbi:hypothetical protein D9623_29180 [Azospirillum brasilense]|uniref:hypothetical protein n=1 Tax=Azospirillum brasilense TaxID=192 RepID=UPI0011EF6742|nr:hypothetical protein [Azospirillum brasilense]QEM01164.1 hypothetical protein D9623_29180 [Azospirillum brasilense]